MTRWPRPGMSPPGSWCRRHCRRGTTAARKRSGMPSVRRRKKYLGTEYRWGGKSGRGIDCSGLVSSAYMQCGVLIYRDARIVEGWPMHQIPFADKKRGDALYFPGHIAFTSARAATSTPPARPPAAAWSSTALTPPTRCTGKIWSRVCMRWGVCSDKVTHPLRHPCGMPPLPKGEALAIPPQGFGKPPELPFWGSWQSRQALTERARML